VAQTVRQGKPELKRRSKAPWLLWLVAIFAVVSWWLLYQSKYFLIETVSVTGATRITPARVIELAHVNVGQPLIGVNPHQVTKDIAVLPQIKSVTVERSWPHTVVIHVTERKPIAAARTATGYVLVDEQGTKAGVATVLPKGMRVIAADPDTHAMKEAVRVMLQLPPTWKVIGLAAPTQDSVTVTLVGGRTIVVGSSENLVQKFKVASILMHKGYDTINVSAPDAPAIK